ncbi:18S rRNA maturation protein [Sporothrix curviconia]|uniref:rRNA-processing protein EFG1 n=1 Tax=Sporothrix curviconia TaxID=1260050 RepID=A0ABP0B3K5_9PEZI
MGEKRQYGGDADHNGPSAKRYKASGRGGYQQQSGFKKNARRSESSNWAKKRARTIERRLRNPGSLPANVQRDLERELAALQRQIEERQDKRQRAHMISKYHMIRFFERKKAMRRQKQLQKRHDATQDEAEKAELAADLGVAEIDVLYPQYYPFLEAYVSLYPQSGKKGEGKEDGKGDKDGDDGDDGDDKEDGKDNDTDPTKFSRGPRPPMWVTIKTAYEKGGLRALEAIRDRQPAKEGKNAAKDTNGDKPSKKRKETKRMEEDSDSDSGGFFEDS